MIVVFLPLIVYLSVPGEDSAQSTIYIVEELLGSSPPEILPQPLKDRFNVTVEPPRYYIGNLKIMDFRKKDQQFDETLGFVKDRRVRDHEFRE